MKIVFLNTWGETMQDSLAGYIEEQAHSTDIFCFQETYEPVKDVCERLLGDFTMYESYKYMNETDSFPQVIYARTSLDVIRSGDVLKGVDGVGLGFFVEVQHGASSLYVCNVHGVSRPGHKLDTPERLAQSQGLIDYFAGKTGDTIIGGDFNILPDTQSISMFTARGYHDLIRDYHIETTRNRLAWERFPESPMLYSDYAFTSVGVDVDSFVVPRNEISDHLPLELVIR